MTDFNGMFDKKKVIFHSLIPFGFIEGESNYTYSTEILDGEFKLTVSITKDGIISSTVVDNSTGEPYVLHLVSQATGAFVGQIREAYEEVLVAIVENCFDRDIFKSRDTESIIGYIRTAYESEPEFLWERFPDNAIFRRKDTNKWYGALLILSKRKLGLDSNERVEILDLCIPPEEMKNTVDNRKYFPGYHTNKKHWYTICLGDSLLLKEIYHRIDVGYALAK